jgi:hypothetical protein
MTVPSCPVNYDCTFIPHAPKHYYDHWWDGPWGQWVALAALIALAVVLCVAAYQIAVARQSHHELKAKLARQELEERQAHARRNHELAMSEQLTMQLDTAKDSPDLLAWVDRHRPNKETK